VCEQNLLECIVGELWFSGCLGSLPAKMKSGTAVLAAAADIRKARNSAMTNLSCKPILAYLIPRIRSWHPRVLEERATLYT
jgi:hypothetical protein